MHNLIDNDGYNTYVDIKYVHHYTESFWSSFDIRHYTNIIEWKVLFDRYN